MSEVRVGAVQAKRRLIPYTIPTVRGALETVRRNLDELAALAEKGAEAGCDILAFPEDTLGTLEWEAGNWERTPDLLRPAVDEMLSRFGDIAARTRMPIICCNDVAEGSRVYNTAILIGADGSEIGRYRKVQLPIHEQARTRGGGFPVFDVPGIGTVGMCICYDMVFPETTRALALAGADIVFHPTMGGASMAGESASLAAFRTRAADNFLYLVVAFRGGGSLIIGPKGDVLAEGEQEPDALVTADIDLSAGRDAGDALGGVVSDFRARLFRERVPDAYAILMEPHPPAMDRLSGVPVPTGEEASSLCAEGMTTGADAFYEADRWLAEGKLDAARTRFQALSERFTTLWIGRVSRERLARFEK